MESFTTSGPYTRAYAYDRRNGRDDADAWQEPSGIRFFMPVGIVPTGAHTFTQCDRCWGEGKAGAFLGDSFVPGLECKVCGGTGWTNRAA